MEQDKVQLILGPAGQGPARREEGSDFVHGGPAAEPGDAGFIMQNTTHCHGFYGASSMERLPVEVALRDQTRAFKQIDRTVKASKSARKAGKTK